MCVMTIIVGLIVIVDVSVISINLAVAMTNIIIDCQHNIAY